MVESAKMTLPRPPTEGVYAGEGDLPTAVYTPFCKGALAPGTLGRWTAQPLARLPASRSMSQPRPSGRSSVTDPHGSPGTYLKSIFRITVSIIQSINEPLEVKSQHSLTSGVREVPDSAESRVKTCYVISSSGSGHHSEHTAPCEALLATVRVTSPSPAQHRPGREGKRGLGQGSSQLSSKGWCPPSSPPMPIASGTPLASPAPRPLNLSKTSWGGSSEAAGTRGLRRCQRGLLPADVMGASRLSQAYLRRVSQTTLGLPEAGGAGEAVG